VLFCVLSFSQGGKAGAVQKCVACRGRGMRVLIRQLAPGMVQQMQSVCTDCNGEGEPRPYKDTVTSGLVSVFKVHGHALDMLVIIIINYK